MWEDLAEDRMGASVVSGEAIFHKGPRTLLCHTGDYYVY